MTEVIMTGPYFKGQQLSSCGHYYPNVLRLRDKKRKDGTFIRIIDCRYCGRYKIKLSPDELDEELVHELNKKNILSVYEKKKFLKSVRRNWSVHFQIFSRQF